MNTQIEERLTRIESLLTMQKTVLNLEEVAELTGLSKSHIYKLCHLKKIPFYKPNGKQNFFSRSEVEKWLLRNPLNTKEQTEAQAISYVTLTKRGGIK